MSLNGLRVRKHIQRTRGRSGNARCQVCGECHLLVLHHLRGRKIPDWNKWWNEVWLCPSCHDEVHSTPPRVIIDGWVSTSAGKELSFRRAGEPQNLLAGDTSPIYPTSC